MKGECHEVTMFRGNRQNLHTVHFSNHFDVCFNDVGIRQPSATRSDGGDDGTYSEPDIVWSETGGVPGVSQACAKCAL